MGNQASIEDCASRSEEACTYPCQLEYSADDRPAPPVCVPQVQSLRGTRLVEKELSTVKEILLKILPRLESVNLAEYLSQLRPDMQAYIDRKIADEVTLNQYNTWRELVTRVAATVVEEISSGCPCCWEDLNDPNGAPVMTTPCCGGVMHRNCYDQWVQSRGECMVCRAKANMNGLVRGINGLVRGIIHEVEQHAVNEGIDFGAEEQDPHTMVQRFKMFIGMLVRICLMVVVFITFVSEFFQQTGMPRSYDLRVLENAANHRGISINQEWFDYNVYNETSTPLYREHTWLENRKMDPRVHMVYEMLEQNAIYSQLWEEQYLKNENTDISALKSTLFAYEKDFHDVFRNRAEIQQYEQWDQVQDGMEASRRLKFARKYIKDRKEMRRQRRNLDQDGHGQDNLP